MEMKIRQNFPEDVKGRVGDTGIIGAEKGTRKQHQQALALLGVGLKGIFPLSIWESGRMELVKGNGLGNDFA